MMRPALEQLAEREAALWEALRVGADRLAEVEADCAAIRRMLIPVSEVVERMNGLTR